ncbi:MAG: hypothetical protein ABIH47_04335 [Candidatus Omnitrophota bacterium]
MITVLAILLEIVKTRIVVNCCHVGNKLKIPFTEEEKLKMKHNLETYLPFPLLLWRAITQPFHEALAWSVDLLLRIKLRQIGIYK